jgi:uncharacterized protein (TIGR02147 family)
VLKRKRTLALKKIIPICDELELTGEERSLFISSAYKEKSNSDFELEIKTKKNLDDYLYRELIVEWKYYLVLTLFSLSDFKHDLDWMMEKSGLGYVEISKILCCLIEMGLLKYENGKYIYSGEYTRTKPEKLSMVVQEAHKNHLELAKNKIESVDIEQRSFRFVTMPFNSQKMDRAKEIISEFLSKLESELEDENTDEVYRVGVQLFPLKNEKLKNNHH